MLQLKDIIICIHNFTFAVIDNTSTYIVYGYHTLGLKLLSSNNGFKNKKLWKLVICKRTIEIGLRDCGAESARARAFFSLSKLVYVLRLQPFCIRFPFETHWPTS